MNLILQRTPKCILVIAVFLIGLVSTPSVSSGADVKEQAKKHFDTGIRLSDEGRLQEALVEFQQAYDLTRHYAVLYNIGQVLALLARPVEAVDALERFLAEAGKNIDPSRQSKVQKEIQRQLSRVALLEIQGLPDGALLQIDGKDTGMAPFTAPIKAGVGTHEISASAPGFERAAQTVTVAGGETRVVSIPLVKTVAAAPVVGTLPSAGPEAGSYAAHAIETKMEVATTSVSDERGDGTWWLGRKWTWVAAGATVVLAAGATTAGVLMQLRFDELSSECGKNSASRPGCSQSDIDAVDTRRTTANVLWGLTAAAALTTGALYFLEDDHKVTAAPMALDKPGITVSGRF